MQLLLIFLLLPSSLKSLAKSFGVLNKSSFPFTFLDEGLNPLDYKGPAPDNKYYLESNVQIPNDLPELWDVREESIKYCINDCVSLLLRTTSN